MDRKKQYSQSRLQMAPVGLAIRWKASGAFGNGQDGAGDFGFDTHRMQDATFRERLSGVPASGLGGTIEGKPAVVCPCTSSA